MSNGFTEVTHESWFTRLKNAIGGVLFGIVLGLGSFAQIFWNEGRAVKRAQDLSEGKSKVKTVAVDSIDTANEGKLVHVQGKATTSETLTDSRFGISLKAIRLKRVVEMYQWKETKKSKSKKKLGGGRKTTTTYSYKKIWSASLIRSNNFHSRGRDKYSNPTSMHFQAQSKSAGLVTLGAFRLSSNLVSSISNWETVEPNQSAARDNVRIAGSEYYVGRGGPSSPIIGDCKIRIRAVKPTTVSVVAAQATKTLSAYTTSGGRSLSLLQVGTHTAAAMFKAAEDANVMLTWILRVVGFFMMFFGILLVFKPLEVFADVIPFVGNILGFGLAVFAFAIAAPMTLVTIAIGWIVYRPLMGILLLAAAIGIFVGIKKMVSGKQPTSGSAAAPPPVPPQDAPKPPPVPTGA